MKSALLFRLIGEKLASEYHRMCQFDTVSLTLDNITEMHDELVRIYSSSEYFAGITDYNELLRYVVLLRRFVSK